MKFRRSLVVNCRKKPIRFSLYNSSVIFFIPSGLNDSVGEMHEQVEKLNKELASSKTHVEQQASIIKRFKRKLLLTSKERDSFKGVLESYEHELTFTGGQFEKDRLTALEKVVSNHR